MPKTRQKKEEEVASVKEKLARSKSVVIASQRGVLVRDIELLRRHLRSVGAEMQTVKKSLLTRAFSSQNRNLTAATGEGTVSLAFSYDDEASAPKAIHDFSKKNEGMVIIGGLLHSETLSVDAVKALALLPSREIVLSQFIAAVQSPVSGIMNVGTELIRKLIRSLAAVASLKNEQ